MEYTTILADAHRPAQALADITGLPMTVFYHPDYAYGWMESGAKILKDKKSEVKVTWLPTSFFN